MKNILTILFILLSVKGYSQSTTPQFLGGKNSNLIVQSVFNMADSPKASFNLLLPDTATAKTYFSGNLKGRWARQSGRLYYNPSGLRFTLADSVTGGGGGSVDSVTFYTNYRADTSRNNIYAAIASSGGSTDTTSLSNRIDLKLNIVDTVNIRLRPIAGSNMTISGTYPNLTFASSAFYDSVLMATKYGVDTAKASIRSSIPSISGLVPYTGATSDVNLGSNGLSTQDLTINYASGSGVAASITKGGSGEALTVVKSSGSGNAASITGGVTLLDELHLNTDLADAYIASSSTWNAKVSTSQLADSTVALRGIIDTKQNNSDTTTWDATKKNLADTSATLRALIGGGGVSAASVAEINTGTDNTKFASALGLQGSKYLDQSGTKLAGTTAGTSTAYTLTLTPAITSYTTGLSLWVKFHVANTGASTINVNGLGAKTLVKDISTALVANDIPINQWYTIVYDGTNFLIQDIGFGGVNLSARLSGSLSDETGTGVAVFGTTPTFTTSVLGGATFSAFNTVTTNLSIAGAATTFTEGGTPTTGLTATYFGNATASGQTKTLNFGTGGASGSTTAINIGSATSGATNNIRMNILPASDATGDIWFRNASGFMTRLGIGTTGQVLTVASGLPSWATAGAGSGWGLTGNAGTNPSTNFVGTSDAQDFVGKANNVGLLRLTSATSVVLGEYGTMIGASNVGMGYQTFINGASSFAAGTLAKSVGTSVFAFGWQADNSANHSMLFNCTGSTATNTTANHAKFVVPNGLTIESTAGMFVPPVMTATQAEAIASKPTGGIIYSTTGTGTFITTVGWWGWNGTAWEKLDP